MNSEKDKLTENVISSQALFQDSPAIPFHMNNGVKTDHHDQDKSWSIFNANNMVNTKSDE